MIPTEPPSRPRPIASAPAGDGGLVPPRWLEQAPVTRAIIALNVGVFAAQLLLTAGRSYTHLPEREALAFGASYPLATIGDNRWETLVTCCFLHDGLIHIAFNMIALWQAGPLVERLVGSARLAPMYLLAGVGGGALSLASAWLQSASQISVGASGAICGVLASALVVGWRVQGWRGPLTQAMVRWLGLVVVFGLLSSRLGGGSIDNAAHLGGAITGAAISALWRRNYRYSDRATNVILALCGGAVALCIGIVGLHDATDPFAALSLEERREVTAVAAADGRCEDARRGLQAVERLRGKMAPVTSLRKQVETTCGP